MKIQAWLCKPSEMHPIFRACTLCLVKNKKIPLDLQVFSRIGKKNEKVTVNSKYYHEHQPTCNILIKFTYHLLMDWETFN